MKGYKDIGHESEAAKLAKHTDISQSDIEKLCSVYKALGEVSRLKILLALMAGEMCVYHISECTNLKQSLTSHQLKVLKNSNLVSGRREGQLILYKLADDHVRDIINQSLIHLNCYEKEI